MKKGILALFALVALNLSAQNALNFDGADDYVSSNFQGVAGSNARTVEAWIRSTANTDPTNGGAQNAIISWGAWSPNGSRFTFSLLYGGAIRLEIGGSGVSGVTDLTDGQWHHVAGVYDPSLSSNRVKLYVDGALDTQGDFSSSLTMNTQATPFEIGRRNGLMYFNGDIDEVRVWNFARSQAGIVADTGAEYCSLPAGLMAYYRLNQGNASGNNTGLTNVVEDVSAANGTLQNFTLSGSSSNWVSGSGIQVKGSSFVQVTKSACNSYKGPGGVIYDTTGIYLDTLQNVYGCDSVIETNLTVQELDLTVTATSTVMTANKTNAVYRWLDCNNNYAMVIGGTQRTFTPPNPSGSYAVQIKYGGCTDTSTCYSLVGIGLDENSISPFRIYPNPSKGKLSISHPGMGAGSISIFSASGQMVKQIDDLGNGQTEVNMALQPKGIYFIRLASGNESYVDRIVIE